MAASVALLALIEAVGDEDEVNLAVNHVQAAQEIVKYFCTSRYVDARDPTAHVQEYFKVTMPKYTDFQFKEHFRMDRETFEVGDGFLQLVLCVSMLFERHMYPALMLFSSFFLFVLKYFS